MNDTLDSYIDRVEHLPATPGILVKLMALFRQPDREVDDIVQLMSQDPSLTAEVLRLCNTAAFARDEPIADVFEAIVRLGFYEVYQLTSAMFGARTFSIPEAGDGIDVKRLWRHSAGTAVTAGLIAQLAAEPDGLAFTAGLLHDVGKLVLASAESAAYSKVTHEAGDCGAMLRDAESRRFGCSHDEVGARLMMRWRVPDPLRAAVQSHHQTCRIADLDRLSAIVSLGNQLAHAADGAGDDMSIIQLGTPETLKALRVLDLQENQMPPLLRHARKQAEYLTGLLAA